MTTTRTRIKYSKKGVADSKPRDRSSDPFYTIAYEWFRGAMTINGKKRKVTSTDEAIVTVKKKFKDALIALNPQSSWDDIERWIVNHAGVSKIESEMGNLFANLADEVGVMPNSNTANSLADISFDQGSIAYTVTYPGALLVLASDGAMRNDAINNPLQYVVSITVKSDINALQHAVTETEFELDVEQDKTRIDEVLKKNEFHEVLANSPMSTHPAPLHYDEKEVKSSRLRAYSREGVRDVKTAESPRHLDKSVMGIEVTSEFTLDGNDLKDADNSVLLQLDTKDIVSKFDKAIDDKTPGEMGRVFNNAQPKGKLNKFIYDFFNNNRVVEKKDEIFDRADEKTAQFLETYSLYRKQIRSPFTVEGNIRGWIIEDLNLTSEQKDALLLFLRELMLSGINLILDEDANLKPWINRFLGDRQNENRLEAVKQLYDMDEIRNQLALGLLGNCFAGACVRQMVPGARNFPQRVVELINQQVAANGNFVSQLIRLRKTLREEEELGGEFSAVAQWLVDEGEKLKIASWSDPCRDPDPISLLLQLANAIHLLPHNSPIHSSAIKFLVANCKRNDSSLNDEIYAKLKLFEGLTKYKYNFNKLPQHLPVKGYASLMTIYARASELKDDVGSVVSFADTLEKETELLRKCANLGLNLYQYPNVIENIALVYPHLANYKEDLQPIEQKVDQRSPLYLQTTELIAAKCAEANALLRQPDFDRTQYEQSFDSFRASAKKTIAGLNSLRDAITGSQNEIINAGANAVYENGCKFAVEQLKKPSPDLSAFNEAIENSTSIVRNPGNEKAKTNLTNNISSLPKKYSGWSIFGASLLCLLGAAAITVGFVGTAFLGFSDLGASAYFGLKIGGACFAAAGLMWGSVQAYQYRNSNEFALAGSMKKLSMFKEKNAEPDSPVDPLRQPLLDSKTSTGGSSSEDLPRSPSSSPRSNGSRD